MKIVMALILFGFVIWANYSMNKSDSGQEKAVVKQTVITEQKDETDYMTDEEKKSKEWADNIPNFVYWVMLILIISSYSAVYFGYPFAIVISLVCCVILYFYGWELIVSALIVGIGFVPLCFYAVVHSLFGNNK